MSVRPAVRRRLVGVSGRGGGGGGRVVHGGAGVVTPAPFHQTHGRVGQGRGRGRGRGSTQGRSPTRLLQARPLGQSLPRYPVPATRQGLCAGRARASGHRQVQRLVELVLDSGQQGAVPRVVKGSVAVVVREHAALLRLSGQRLRGQRWLFVVAVGVVVLVVLVVVVVAVAAGFWRGHGHQCVATAAAAATRPWTAADGSILTKPAHTEGSKEISKHGA